MSRIDFIRAWKDEDYRLSLSAEEISHLPENPAGFIDLSDSELNIVVGASTQQHTLLAGTWGCCITPTLELCPTLDPRVCSLTGAVIDYGPTYFMY